MSKEESWDEFLRRNASRVPESQLESELESFIIEHGTDFNYSQVHDYDEQVKEDDSLEINQANSSEKMCLGCATKTKTGLGSLTKSTYARSHPTLQLDSGKLEKSSSRTKLLHRAALKRAKTGNKIPTMGKDTENRSGSRKESRSSGSGSSRESSRRRKYHNHRTDQRSETVNWNFSYTQKPVTKQCEKFAYPRRALLLRLRR